MGVNILMLVIFVVAAVWFYKCCWVKDAPAAAAKATFVAEGPALVASSAGAAVRAKGPQARVLVTRLAGSVAGRNGPSSPVMIMGSAAEAVARSGSMTPVLVDSSGSGPSPSTEVLSSSPSLISVSASSLPADESVMFAATAASVPADTPVLVAVEVGSLPSSTPVFMSTSNVMVPAAAAVVAGFEPFPRRHM